MVRILSVAGALLLCSGQAVGQALPAGVRAVRAGAPAGGDGLTWATAWNDLHAALGAAAGSGGQITQVWLTVGEYSPPTVPDCLEFVVSNVSVYGGFAGYETSPLQRPPSARSWLRGGGCLELGPEALVLVTGSSNVVLDGLLISGSYGGGLLIEAPIEMHNVVLGTSLRYCVRKVGATTLMMDRCVADNPGSILGDAVVLSGPGAITNSTFDIRGVVQADAVRLTGLDVRDCTFSLYADNWALRGDDSDFSDCTIDAAAELYPVEGGRYTRCRIDGSTSNQRAVSIESATSCIIEASSGYQRALLAGSLTDCVVMVEAANSHGGGAEIGSLVRSRVSGFGHERSILLGSASESIVDFDGGFYVLELEGSASLVNCIVRGRGSIGGVRAADASAPWLLVNCLFQFDAPDPLGTWRGFEVGPYWRFRNCIIWGDPVAESQLFLLPNGGNWSIEHSTVRGWTGSLGGTGNNGLDPLLHESGALLAGSPCIDSGSGAALPAGTLRDLIGNCRAVDGDQNGSAVVDRGPLEFRACVANCDCSTDSPVLNVADFTCYLQRYAAGEAWANCDGSTTPPVLNVADFTCFLQRYAAGCP
jgi:hypothetical protein